MGLFEGSVLEVDTKIHNLLFIDDFINYISMSIALPWGLHLSR